MAKHPKRPRDPNQLAKLILDITTGERPNDSPRPGQDTPATEARRKGGLKVGPSEDQLLPAGRHVTRRARRV